MSAIVDNESLGAAAASKLIDGTAIAATIRAEVKELVSTLKERSGVTVGLAVVLVGSRRDSATYVRMKKKACEEVGVQSLSIEYAEDVTQDTLVAKIVELNQNPHVHGILVQLPLPAHIDEKVVLDLILPEKDVDGLHPMNVARLANTKTHSAKGQAGSFSSFHLLDFNVACTPQGCIELLDRSGVDIEGREAVVIGRSNMVGIPVSLLLMQRNATVTICHSRSRDLPGIVRRADIVIAAVGRAEMVRGDWLKPGCVVIDVGINSVDDSSDKRGYRLVGDCHFDSCREVAGLITPVPGGVGPMTIAILLRNTAYSASRAIEAQSK